MLSRVVKYIFAVAMACLPGLLHSQGLIQGLLNVCSSGTNSYLVSGHRGYSFNWQISGGELMNGQGTDSISVGWRRNASGKVIITATDKISGKKLYDTAWINIDTACVWPGDANHDHKVNYQDILAIGEAYEKKHPPCTDTSSLWQGYPRCSWHDTIGLGIDMKHADCNGDGVVDSMDVLVVSKNYSFSFQKTVPPCPPPVPGDPLLQLYTGIDTLNASDSIYLLVDFGASVSPVSGAYGLAFSINYDPEVIDSTSIRASMGYEWMTALNNGPVLHFFKNVPSQGHMDFAISRTDHTACDGFGEVAHIRMKARKDIPSYKMWNHFTLGEFQYISRDGGALSPLSKYNDSSYISRHTTGIAGMVDPTIRVSLYPNPSSAGNVTVNCPSGIKSIAIYNTLGEQIIIKSAEVSANLWRLDLSGFTKGIYIVNIKGLKGNPVFRKLEIF